MAKETVWAHNYLGEFLGTYFLVLTVGCNVLTDSIGAALSIGAVLMAMIYTIGPVSGAHFNPAVTTAVILRGSFKGEAGLGMMLMYIPVQLLGGLLAGLTYMSVLGNTFALEPVGRYTWHTALALEALYTAALCYVVLGVCAQKGNHFSGIAIGFTYTAAVFAIGGISGCSLNPSVSFGAASSNAIAVGSKTAFQWFPLYFGAPFLGAVVGVGLFSLVFPQEMKRA